MSMHISFPVKEIILVFSANQSINWFYYNRDHIVLTCLKVLIRVLIGFTTTEIT